MAEALSGLPGRTPRSTLSPPDPKHWGMGYHPQGPEEIYMRMANTRDPARKPGRWSFRVCRCPPGRGFWFLIAVPHPLDRRMIQADGDRDSLCPSLSCTLKIRAVRLHKKNTARFERVGIPRGIKFWQRDHSSRPFGLHTHCLFLRASYLPVS